MVKRAQRRRTAQNITQRGGSLIASVANDITIPLYTGVLTHQDDTLLQRGGGRGLKIYDEIERDTHAYAVLLKRKRAVVAREWVVEAASDADLDQEAAAFVREQLRNLPFDQICEDLLDATLKGFAISEIVWARADNRIVPERIVTHNQRRFAFDRDWRPRLLTFANMLTGEELPDRKFIVHRFGVKGNNPYGLGMGYRLFWPVVFKREGVTFWLHFIEKFAAPTVVGYVPQGASPEDSQQVLRLLERVRGSSAITLPIGADAKFLEATRSGEVSYGDFLKYWDTQISIAVLGETLTTDIGDTGSRAASETHADVFDLLIDGDADLLSASLRETLIRWLIDYNFPGAGVPHVWRTRPENEAEVAGLVKVHAEARSAWLTAVQSALSSAKGMNDDAAERFIIATGLTRDLDEAAIRALIATRGQQVQAEPTDGRDVETD